MFIISFIIILALIFAGMIVFMRQTFNRSVLSATAHLEQLLVFAEAAAIIAMLIVFQLFS